MGTKGKKDLTDNVVGILPNVSYLLIQTAMLFAMYGLGYTMPFWVVWFPTIFFICLIFIIFLIMLVIAVVSAVV